MTPSDVGTSAAGTRVGLIWAEAEGGVIGRGGVMPWHIPEDLAHFKAITLGNSVVMGRKTWESLPERFRPLDGRRNIVVTRQHDWSADGVEVVHSVDDAFAPAKQGITDGGWIWVIGGAEIFQNALERADRIEVTEIRAEITGDTFAPAIPQTFRVVDRDPDEGWRTSRTGATYRFLRYERTA
jgi:dihydrofolate reductase